VSAAITTHVLDTARGRPAAAVRIALERADGDAWERVGSGTTDGDGRLRDLGTVEPGHYRLRFDTGAYLGPHAFYPEVVVSFRVAAGEDHYHVPLLLNPYGYSTYRGS
jgi:5-hydroxyisourate hydrolase